MRKKRRRPKHYGSDSEDRLWRAASGRDPHALAYVYRLDRRGRPTTPYAAKWETLDGADELLTSMLEHCGPGGYRIIIKSGRQIQYSGIAYVGPFTHQRSAEDESVSAPSY